MMNKAQTILCLSRLTGACKKADLRRADLWRANLRWADLRRADLREANLWRADLRGADLRGADLRWADLSEADLSEADLRGVNLWGADLRGADLRGVDLTACYLPSGARVSEGHLITHLPREAPTRLLLWIAETNAEWDKVLEVAREEWQPFILEAIEQRRQHEKSASRWELLRDDP